MKVFVDCRWFSQPGQGVVTYISALHHEVERYLSKVENRRFEFWYGVDSLADIDSSLLPSSVNVLEMGKHGMLWRLFVLPFKLKKLGFEAAHFQYVCPVPKLGLKYITTVHDILFVYYPEFFSLGHRLPRLALYYLTAKRSDLLLTVSERSAQDIRAWANPSRKIAIVYNGAGIHKKISGNQTKPVASIGASRYILTVGRVEPRKNYGRLVDAFAASQAATSGIKLVIVGFCAPEFQDELKNISSTANVIWLERVADAELTWLYQNAIGFVYPSICEGFGIPVLEAIEANLPCAISTTFPLDDVVGVADVTFDPCDTNQMSNAIDALLQSGNGQRDRRSVLLKYSWEQSALQYLEALTTLENSPAS
ncbi:MAG: glycosyltransferase family 4 protein [Burkholderiales bacterium]|nr:glycosyltransferase family 4 protein [Burkholderiales bacterium]